MPSTPRIKIGKQVVVMAKRPKLTSHRTAAKNSLTRCRVISREAGDGGPKNNVSQRDVISGELADSSTIAPGSWQ